MAAVHLCSIAHAGLACLHQKQKCKAIQIPVWSSWGRTGQPTEWAASGCWRRAVAAVAAAVAAHPRKQSHAAPALRCPPGISAQLSAAIWLFGGHGRASTPRDAGKPPAPGSAPAATRCALQRLQAFRKYDAMPVTACNDAGIHTGLCCRGRRRNGRASGRPCAPCTTTCSISGQAATSILITWCVRLKVLRDQRHRSALAPNCACAAAAAAAGAAPQAALARPPSDACLRGGLQESTGGVFEAQERIMLRRRAR